MSQGHHVCSKFWERTARGDGCWLWLGTIERIGYGVLSITEPGRARVCRKAHRVSWEIHNGQIPHGMDVLHRCDVRACVNPSHLFLGTHQDNMRDRDAKRRQAHGERHSRAILTESAVVGASWLNHLGLFSKSDLARRFGVSASAMTHAISGRTWTHLPCAKDVAA